MTTTEQFYGAKPTKASVEESKEREMFGFADTNAFQAAGTTKRD
jgi:hypothetical protein